MAVAILAAASYDKAQEFVCTAEKEHGMKFVKHHGADNLTQPLDSLDLAKRKLFLTDDGNPYLIVGTERSHCKHGTDDHKRQKRKYIKRKGRDLTKLNTERQHTVECTATCLIRRIIKFIEYQISKENPTEVLKQMKANAFLLISNQLKESEQMQTLQMIEQFEVRITIPSQHSKLLPIQQDSTQQTAETPQHANQCVDSAIKEKIRDLILTHDIVDIRDIRRHIEISANCSSKPPTDDVLVELIQQTLSEKRRNEGTDQLSTHEEAKIYKRFATAEEAQAFISEYECKHGLKYSIRCSKKKKALTGDSMIIKRNKAGRLSLRVDYTKDGYPCIWFNTTYYTCHRGRDRHDKQKKAQQINRDNEVLVKRRCTSSKKIGCPAGGRLRQLALFKQFKPADSMTKYDRELISKQVREEFASPKHRNSICYELVLDSLSTHQGHPVGNVGTSAPARLPIDKRLVRKIHELINAGVDNFRIIKSLLRSYVLELFPDERKRPAPDNTRFYPVDIIIRNHMKCATKARDSEPPTGKLKRRRNPPATHTPPTKQMKPDNESFIAMQALINEQNSGDIVSHVVTIPYHSETSGINKTSANSDVSFGDLLRENLSILSELSYELDDQQCSDLNEKISDFIKEAQHSSEARQISVTIVDDHSQASHDRQHVVTDLANIANIPESDSHVVYRVV